MSGDALIFTLARLGPPGLSTAERALFLPHDLVPDRDALAAQQSAMPPLAAAGGFAGRVLGDAASGGGLGGGTSGLLKLPQAFGAVYLGQVRRGNAGRFAQPLPLHSSAARPHGTLSTAPAHPAPTPPLLQSFAGLITAANLSEGPITNLGIKVGACPVVQSSSPRAGCRRPLRPPLPGPPASPQHIALHTLLPLRATHAALLHPAPQPLFPG